MNGVDWLGTGSELRCSSTPQNGSRSMELEKVIKKCVVSIHAVVHGHSVLVHSLDEGVPHLLELSLLPLERVVLQELAIRTDIGHFRKDLPCSPIPKLSSSDDHQWPPCNALF